MEETRAAPAPKHRLIVGAIAPIVVATALAGGLVARSMANPVRHGLDAPATILSRSDDRAVVRFTTAAGALTTTTVAICHHQAYRVGGTLLVRYAAKEPANAAERDMLPGPNLVLPGLVMLLGLAGALPSLGRLRRRAPSQPPAAMLASEDAPATSPFEGQPEEAFAVIDT